ncbi:efflux RND transporter periplasmic adaptor subunit [Pedobacter duraquae]|uniref:RND family efflux transporter MFP subunit n=1 Tax=Pedobacter duraquae TaxID=425511 RepID=A0A4R6IRX1_9SPHI|nr:efflux RND transporter periplasmic adaptor subunit [Pedobacter duraquae]TDO24706.1 RND family efflux transporter MFP subunit [Pedobacter duraquae]
MKIYKIWTFFFFGSVVVTSCHAPKPVEKTDDKIPVRLISATALQQSEPIETSGLLSSDKQSNLSFKGGGIISRILVDGGDHVSAGQLLAVLNLTEVNAQLNQAEENFNKLQRDAQRTANLFKDSVSTREQYENTQTALTIAKRQLEIARYNATQSSIIAPSDGVVLKKSANVGERVEGGVPVFFVGGTATSDWIITCGITDKDRSRLTGSETAEISFDTWPETFTGKIKSLSQGSDVASGLYQVEVRVDAGGKKLVSGLFAKVKIIPKTKTNLLSVPMDALIEGENDNAYVFVASGKYAQKKAVKVAYLSGDRVFLLSGIQVTDQVIRQGSAYLNNGSEIKIVK